MRTITIIHKLERWIENGRFGGEAKTKRTVDGYDVEFEVRTTKTRASSIVTRIELLAAEISPSATVGKVLISDEPETRSDLATWKIFAHLDTRTRRRDLLAA